MSDTSPEFCTDSFQLASYLLSESCRLIRLDKANAKRVAFVFEDTFEREDLTRKFLSHEALVEPHRFFAAQRDLKQLMYA